MKSQTYNVGDIVRWKSASEKVDYCYGIVIESEKLIEGGEYIFSQEVIEDPYDNLKLYTPVISIKIYSFWHRRAIELYKNPEDIPLFLEKV